MTVNFIMESDSFHDHFNVPPHPPLYLLFSPYDSLHCPLPLFLSRSLTQRLVSLQNWTSRQTPVETRVRGPPRGPRAMVFNGQERRRTAKSGILSPLSPCPTNPCQPPHPNDTQWRSAGRSSSAPATPQLLPGLERSAGGFPAVHLHR